jgi:hypothetical protein
LTGGWRGKTVTEADWMASTDPQPMIECLRGKVSERKLRLFAAAAARRIWRQLTDERSRRGVEAVEEYVNGQASDQDLRRAGEAAGEAAATGPWKYHWSPVAATAAAAACRNPMTIEAAAAAARGAVDAADLEYELPLLDRLIAEESDLIAQCQLLRDLFGNPFCPATISPFWLTWNDATVVRLAQSAYAERHMPEGTLDNGRLAVLADALEEAGCNDADVLGHLRGPGPHVRGCWPVDLCLGKF